MLLWWILRVAVVDLACCCGGSLCVSDISIILVGPIYRAAVVEPLYCYARISTVNPCVARSVYPVNPCVARSVYPVNPYVATPVYPQ